MDIELFVSGCHLCTKTEDMVRKVMGAKCSLRIYDLAKSQGMKEAKKYNVRTIPTIVGNGRKMFEGVPKFGELVQCSIEHGCKGHLLDND